MPPVVDWQFLLRVAAKPATAAGSYWTGDLSAEVTAIATAVLAAFAIVTAYYARKAFLKQSQEVSDQASMLKVQSDQLEQQRKINAEQTKVLELQARELQESLAERKREAEARRSAQASQVSLAVKMLGFGSFQEGMHGGPLLEATAVNASERQQPIYNTKLYWYCGQEGYGSPNPEPLGTVLNWERESRRREFSPEADPGACGAFLTFRDAAGVDWIRTADGDIMQADSDTVPDLVKALLSASGNDASSPQMPPDVGE